jgi:hypothetical protein
MTENWRQVWIRGSVAPAELSALIDLIRPDAPLGIHPFSYVRPRTTGLNLWPSPTMDVVGDLALPVFAVKSLALWAGALPRVAPSLLLTIDVGSPFRDPRCEATILVDASSVTILEPQVLRLREITLDEQLERAEAVLLWQLEGRQY